MAELIPPQYLVQMATKRSMERWALYGIVTLAICAACILTAFTMHARTTARINGLRAEHKARANLILQAQDLQAKRADLAARMEKIQHLMDDHVLLTILRDIAMGFTPNERLEFVHIDSGNHPDATQGTGDGSPAKPMAHVTGITHTSGTLGELMSRLSGDSPAAQKAPPMNVELDASRSESFLDGQVMRFQLNCARADAE